MSQINPRKHLNILKTLQAAELPEVKKDVAVLTNPRFQTPKTSMVIFHFQPHRFQSPALRLETCTLKRERVEQKDVYIIDDFFLADESRELREITAQAAFSRSIYADHESNEKGEHPSRSMDNKERWQFFANPPQAIKEVYKWLSLIAQELNADITTLPWDLCDANICAPAFATNRIEYRSPQSSTLGRHKDYNTEKGVAFGIPILYADVPTFYPSQFINGEAQKPWLVTLMVYTTAENFKPEFGMGTAFFKDNGEIVLQSECRDMRMVLFEGDIIHSIEESKISPDFKTWRASYVYKLCINPREAHQDLKSEFYQLMKQYKEQL
ncbi:MAG: hypothetical protein CK425_03155 [Parachlamydia sp.]|nr:MAG: hypothetical protein CK425_03155 [Parachlamydia sp.]